MLLKIFGINNQRPFFMIHITNVFKITPEIIDIKIAFIIEKLFIELIMVSYRTGAYSAASDKPSI